MDDSLDVDLDVMDDDDYVSNAWWLDPAARADTVDEIADQFERRAS